MKKILLAALGLLATTVLNAQTSTTVSMGSAYANNIWYNFETGNAGTSSASNWDIGLAATISTSSDLVTSILFNSKVGTLFVSPSASPADDFADLDTTGMANTWTKLYNDDTYWGNGAFSQSATGSFPDYGWGTYDMVSHTGFAARRVFVIRYGNGTSVPFSYKKLYISLAFSGGGVYTITYDKLDNSDPHTGTVAINDYTGKNFAYYSLTNHLAVDREPAAASWDLLFTQYTSTSELYSGASNQFVGGVLANQGVEIAQANNVEDAETYSDYESLTFSSDNNTIGWDWKTLNYSTFAYEVVTDTVYFVKRANGDIWKLYFTGFGGSSTGNFNFTQEKMSTVTSLFGTSEEVTLALYPNPSSQGEATLIYEFNSSDVALLSITDLSGKVVRTEQFTSGMGLLTHTFSTKGLQPGLYLVTVQANGALLQQKLVIR